MKPLALALALVLAAMPAAADEPKHERARRAVEAGEFLPFRDILARAEAVQPGQFLEAELEEKGGRAVYEVKLLAPGGRVVELYFDARSGELIKSEGGRR